MAKTSTVTAPRIVRDKATTEYFLVIAGAAHPIDRNDLSRTLGCGMHVDCGLIDAWPSEAWVAILAHLSLPAAPFDRARAKLVVRRFVQRLWMTAFQLTDEATTARMAARDAEACAKYAAEFGHETVGGFGETGKRAVTKKSSAVAYAPTSALRTAKALKGQAKALLAFFKRNAFAPATTAQAADGMIAAGLKTSTKPERIAAFYLCDWAKKGWLVRRPYFG